MDVQTQQMMEKWEQGVLEIEDVKTDPVSAFMIIEILSQVIPKQIQVNHETTDIKEAIPANDIERSKQITLQIFTVSRGKLSKIVEMLDQFERHERETVLTLCAICMRHMFGDILKQETADCRSEGLKYILSELKG